MYAKADINDIDYIITTIEQDLSNGFRESSKNEPIYMVIDYYDWLYYMHTIGKSKSINFQYGSDFFSSIYKDSKDIIALTEFNLNSKRSEDLFNNYDKDSLDRLLEGYDYFVRELEIIQLKFIEKYVYNNNNYPKLFIPYSFGINRIVTESYLFLQSKDANAGLLKTDVYEFEMDDNIRRVKANLLGNSCLIGSIINHMDTINTELILPSKWRIASNKTDGTSSNVNRKLKAISQAYLNYFNVGLHKDSFLSNKYDKIFLLNQPFTIPERLEFDITKSGEIGKMKGLKYIETYPKLQ